MANTVKELIENCLPMIREFAVGKYVIAVGGSRGKELSDSSSDVDFRLYADDFIKDEQWDKHFPVYANHLEYWKNRGLIIDGVWMRTISEIDAGLNKYLSGNTEPEMLEWTVWGYYLPTDIFHQQIIEDPNNVAADWKKRLTPYPQAIKEAIINKHLNRLKYWKADYHYKSKVNRKDTVFLASLTASLVRDIMQILFAANEFYFPGDGHNISFSKYFTIIPDDFEKRIESILYPENPDKLSGQYKDMIDMINDVENLIG